MWVELRDGTLNIEELETQGGQSRHGGLSSEFMIHRSRERWDDSSCELRRHLRVGTTTDLLNYQEKSIGGLDLNRPSIAAPGT